MVYNVNAMTDIKKSIDFDDFIKITEADYIELMIDACSQVICFEYESKCCVCETPRDCHGYKDFTESAKSCMGVIGAFGENVFHVQYDKKKLN
jgi:hypothetical protein